MRPRLLDMFCGAGGCSVGYHRAGFDVVGIDHREQPRYPFTFVKADALAVLANREFLERFDVIHASPPCQRFSVANNIAHRNDHPDLVATVRRFLADTGRHYVIENVLGAPLVYPACICGLALGLGVKRHRYFEGSVFLFGTECPLGHRGDYLSVFGHAAQEKVGSKGWVTVYGGGAPATADRRRRASAELARMAMGIDWMSRDELSQAIPPAYTEFIGRQLRAALG